MTADSWGAVLLEATAAFEPTCGARTIRVVPIADAAALPPLLPQDRVECIGTNAAAPDGLRERGVSRVCPVGRMQAPKLSWPRGQRPPLRSLLEDSSDRVMEIELRVIKETLKHTKGDKSLAAQLLGISTRTIYRKLDELGESAPGESNSS